VLKVRDAEHFALRSLDRLLAEGWRPSTVCCTSSLIPMPTPNAVKSLVCWTLRFTVIACLDAYEATADLSYFNFAKRITEAISGVSSTRSPAVFRYRTPAANEKVLGVLAPGASPSRLPTPAGNSVVR